MGHPSTLYRFRIELSDVDRGLYQDLDFRVAMHPSEVPAFLLTRVLAYALSYEDGLEFSPGGLSDPDQPCLRSLGPAGSVATWIEVGNPSARKLHRASKAARNVKVFTYKDPGALLREIEGESVHRAAEIEIRSFAPEFLARLEARLERDNRWSIVHTDGSLSIGIGTGTSTAMESGEIRHHSLGSALR